jgi:hypothetical protein
MAVTKKKPKVVTEQLELYRKATEARYRIAMATFKIQDRKTQLAIEVIRDRLTTAASGSIRIYPNGKRKDSIVVSVDQELVDQNLLYVAIEIVKDLAFMDIQVENFQFGTVHCAECGERLGPRKKKPK